MVASKLTDVINADVADHSSSPVLGCPSSVPCSICFDLVLDDGERSTAKLQCGHKFHLDCIGSAFNTKGTMQCPNCRKVENGRWLFADTSAHGISETSEREWMPNEGPHDVFYSRRPFGFHWCPFSGLTVHSSIEETEPSLNTFTNFHANHAMITEHTASYFRPNVNSISAPRNNLRARDNQHMTWGWNCHFLPYNADRETLRSTHTQAESIARSPSFHHQLHYNPQRFGGGRSLPMVLPPVSSRGFYIHEPESSYNYNTHERDHGPTSFHHHHHRFSTNRNHWS